jgi:hypothetical protein
LIGSVASSQMMIPAEAAHRSGMMPPGIPG